MTAWLRRPYDQSTDEDGVVFLFLKSYAKARARVEPAEPRDIWERHHSVVMFLLARARVEVLCDPVSPEVIWAFAATGPGVVHYAVIKRPWRDMRVQMLADLLREHIGVTSRVTHACPDLAALDGGMTKDWVGDPYLLTRMAFGEAA